MATETVQTLLTEIKNREIVLPEFQREFTWKRDQSRDLVDSLLKAYPVGSLLVWRTKKVPALKNMPDFEANGRVKVLLDGQQRLTSLYMLTRDAIPPYYPPQDIADASDPRGLHFNLETTELKYYRKLEMQNNPRWVRVADCFKNGEVDPGKVAEMLSDSEEGRDKFELYRILQANFDKLRGIVNSEPPMMYVQDDATLKHALTVFDRVNSNGTPLSEADIALAHMCSAWPETRRLFKQKRAELREEGFEFGLTFFIRAINAVANGRAEYQVLHDMEEGELTAAWHTLDRLLDYLINFLRDRAFIYSTDDLNTTNVLIPVLGYLAQNRQAFEKEYTRNRLLHWMYAALFQRRYSGSVDQKLERDLSALQDPDPISGLSSALIEDHGAPEVNASQLNARRVQHPLYNMMQIVIRARGGVDWSNGLRLSQPIGESYAVQRHHIFPKKVLAEAGYDTGNSLIDNKRVHEIANRVPITREGNMDIFTEPPYVYLPKVRTANPGNLERFMIPMDEQLWRVENYEDFLSERRTLIATGINAFMKDLAEGDRQAKQEEPRETLESLISGGESEKTEFKSTLRWHIHAKRIDKEIEHAALKTITAFLNSDGGTLLLGVNDEGEVLGLAADQFQSRDKMLLHLTNIVRDRIGTTFVRFLLMTVHEVDGKDVLQVDCEPAVLPAYLKHGNSEHFYIRTGPSTSELAPSEIHDYVQQRFYSTVR